MPLTELQIKTAKPKDKRYMMPDSDGLYLEVSPKGAKSWRVRIYSDGKEKKITIGKYPHITLKEARDIKNDLHRKNELGEALQTSNPNKKTFRDIYEDYMEKRVLPTMSDARIKGITKKMGIHALPRIGDTSADEIDEMLMLNLLRAIEVQGKIDTAHAVRGICGQIFRYGIASGQCRRDPTAALKGALQTRNIQHRARVQGKENIGALLRAIDGYSGFIVRCALTLEAYFFLRPSEIAALEWSEIEWENNWIRIPPEKTKMRREHIVPLATQAVDLLQQLKPVTGHGRYVFHSRLTPTGSKHITIETMLAALRRIGYAKEEMTVHGFRGIAATELYESGKWSGDAIERQMEHVEGNTVKAAYSYAQYLEERRAMMQWWADYLDGLRDG